jgi:hypothetical protein
MELCLGLDGELNANSLAVEPLVFGSNSAVGALGVQSSCSRYGSDSKCCQPLCECGIILCMRHIPLLVRASAAYCTQAMLQLVNFGAKADHCCTLKRLLLL